MIVHKPTSLLLRDGTLLRHVDTVQKFSNILVSYPAHTVDRSSWSEVRCEVLADSGPGAYQIERHSGRRYPRESAHLFVPSTHISLHPPTSSRFVQSTQDSVKGRGTQIGVVIRTFSPKKLRISTAAPSSWMIQLIGKWA